MSKRNAKAMFEMLELLIETCANEQDQALTFHHPERNLTLHVWVHDGECETDCGECETAELPGTEHRTLTGNPRIAT